MGNISLAYHSLCQRLLSVSITFSTYEGLTCNVPVTYAERMPGVLGASMKFNSNISGRFIGDLSN